MTTSLKPFKGGHYNLDTIKDLSQVVTPPYDVIAPEMQQEFYQKSPYNFVRLDLAREPGDMRYEASRQTFIEWVKARVIVFDEKPTLYFHHHTFHLPDGRTVTRKGFFGVRRIEDFSEGGIKPHEKTLEGPKTDRLKLTRALKAQLSPVFSLYSDPQTQVEHLVAGLKKRPPLVDFVMPDGDRHELWREEDPTVLKLIAEAVEGRPVFIADGHHRYETALNYRNERRALNPQGTGEEAYNYVLMYFSNLDDKGLVILPIHRAVCNLPQFDINNFTSRLAEHIRVTPVTSEDRGEWLKLLEAEGRDSHAFLMITRDTCRSFMLSIRRQAWLDSPVSGSLPRALAGLDVTVMHRLILEEILRISPEAQAKQENLIYWKDTNRAINETRNGACQATFLLNATRIEDMQKVAMAGEKMPQKSTYFYPKVPSGLVFHLVD